MRSNVVHGIAAAAWLLVASVASAVVIPQPMLLNNTAPIPGNGALLITAGWAGEPTVIVTPLMPGGPVIRGSLRALNSDWVWTPDATMAEGTYSVQIISTSFSNESTENIEVTSARIVGPPALTSDPVAAISDYPQSEYACCSGIVDGVLRQTSCFASATTDRIALNTGLASSESASARTQLLFKVGPEPRDPATEELSIPPTDILEAQVLFDDQRDEYCFWIEAMELATGEIYMFPSLPRCAPHGDLPALVQQPREPTDQELDWILCGAPPAGYEERWCALNEDNCGDSTRPGCQLSGHVCRGEPLPGSFGGTGGMSGAGSTSGTGGSASGGTGGVAGMSDDAIAGHMSAGNGASSQEPNDESTPEHRTAGCSVAPNIAAVRGTHAALWLVLCGWLARRRRGRPKAVRASWT